MTDRPHRSIGEVLHLLENEFPEVTISKIRFLESQGLLNPERTPSGYRMFFDADVARLRWILVQQRDNFLPLRVIKKRLDSGDWDPNEVAPLATGAPSPESTTFARVVEPGAADSETADEAPAAEEPIAAPQVAVAPAAEAPAAAAQTADAPIVGTPMAEAPTAGTPIAEAPIVGTPMAEAPTADTPIAEAPTAPDDTPQVVQLDPVAETMVPAAEVALNGSGAPADDAPYLGFEQEDAAVIDAQPVPVVEESPAPQPDPARAPEQTAPVVRAQPPAEAAAPAPQPAAPVAEPQPTVVAQPEPIATSQPPAAAAPPAAAVSPPAAVAPAAAQPPAAAIVGLPSTAPVSEPLHPIAPVVEPEPEPEPDPSTVLAGSQADIAFSITELAEAASLEVNDLRELQKFGIIEAINDDQVPQFDADALMVARAAAAFMSHGLEPRHLKAWRVSAEREAGVLEQLTLPLAKQNSAGASRRALELANDLVSMGSDLRYAMLRRALRKTLKFD